MYANPMQSGDYSDFGVAVWSGKSGNSNGLDRGKRPMYYLVNILSRFAPGNGGWRGRDGKGNKIYGTNPKHIACALESTFLMFGDRTVAPGFMPGTDAVLKGSATVSRVRRAGLQSRHKRQPSPLSPRAGGERSEPGEGLWWSCNSTVLNFW